MKNFLFPPFLLLLVGCAGMHGFDESQVPVVTVGSGVRPVISWTPAAAYELNLYEGSKDGDGIGAIWTARGGAGYENNLRSPVTYGVPPAGSEMRDAPPLIAGRTYTVTVFRKDPKGEGEGFFNTRRRYIGSKTFVASEK